MNSIRRAVSRTVLTTSLLVGAAGCSDKFLNVTNPNVINAATVDPVTGAATLAASAQQNFAVAIGWAAMYSSWMTGETLVMETFPTRNEFGIRTVADNNGNLNGDVWSPLSLGAASAKLVLDLKLPTPESNINLARAATFRGFSILYLATDFCSVTLSSGPELTTNQALDSAIFWFTKAIAIGNAIAMTENTRSVGLIDARLVSRHVMNRRGQRCR